MRILFIGSFPLVEDISSYQNIGFTDVAAYVSQKNIVSALDEELGTPIDIISAVCFPSDKLCKIPRVDKSTNCAYRVSVAYKNNGYLGRINAERALKKEVSAWAKTIKREERVIVFVYSLASRFLGAALRTAKILDNCKVNLIVPDLPQYMHFGKQSILRRILKKIDYKLILHRMNQCVDFYFLYTKFMAQALNIKDGTWTVFEGIPDLDIYSTVVPSKQLDDKFVITYAGALNDEANIVTFINALKQINNKDIRFVVMGSGPASYEIQELSEECVFLDFRGACSHDNVLSQLLSSNLLVIPRSTRYEYTKYSCPSKLLEYMASGVPVLTTKLPGIPDEYLPYVFQFESDDLDGMASTLTRLLSMSNDELRMRGNTARQFLDENKSVEKFGRFLIEYGK